MDGHVAPGYEPVRDVFVRNFDFGEVGAAVAVEVDGQTVVDLWGGERNKAGDPFEADTVVGAFSTTKGVAATCCNRLIDQGHLNADKPVAHYWPEFGAAGKEKITVRHALSHQAGLAAIDGDLTPEDIYDWDLMVAAIAAQEPNWEPGTAHGYHSRTFAWIIGELVRRVTGLPIGRYFREEIGDPYAIDFWIGLPDELDGRCADILGDPQVDPVTLGEPSTLVERVEIGPGRAFPRMHDVAMWNQRSLRANEMLALNGHGSARALARLYSAVMTDAHGPRILSESALAEATRVQASGLDLVIGWPMSFGLGFMIGQDFAPAASPGAFGHSGMGGSLAFGDLQHRLSFGYVMNQMNLRAGSDLRAYLLARSTYECLMGQN